MHSEIRWSITLDREPALKRTAFDSISGRTTVRKAWAEMVRIQSRISFYSVYGHFYCSKNEVASHGDAVIPRGERRLWEK